MLEHEASRYLAEYNQENYGRLQRLSFAPSITFLKHLYTLPFETGLVKQHGWFLIKGLQDEVDMRNAPPNTSVYIHSHCLDGYTDISIPYSVPSPEDWLTCSQTGNNLIVSSMGITEFWTPNTDFAKNLFDKALKIADSEWSERYLTLLSGIGALSLFETIPWDLVNEQVLEELFNPNPFHKFSTHERLF